MSQQRTIQNAAEVAGRGLFTGLPVTVRFKPAEPGAGVVFVRTDQPEPVQIGARLENLSKRARRTSLRNGTASVETIEHCLSAVRALGIDNLIIEMDNAELPSGDGSALPFVEPLKGAGVVEQDAMREWLPITEPVRVHEGDAELVAWPGERDKLEIIYELDYGPGTAIGQQIHRFTLDRDDFAAEIAPARTFVTDEEASQLRAAGLGLHLTYADVLVVGRDGPVENAYRFANECVRHKILDLIGDLMLAGCYVCGKIYARKSGHHLNHELVRRLLGAHTRQQRQEHLARATALDVRVVQRILPHRYPMLLIDRVIEVDGDRRAVGIKNVSINEPFFQGHYPRQPIMPGVLIIEAMAQLSGILLSQKLEHTGRVAVLLSLDNVKFRRPVVPGDQLVIEAATVRVKSRSGETQCRATVAGEPVAEAVIRFMLVDVEPG